MAALVEQPARPGAAGDRAGSDRRLRAAGGGGRWRRRRCRSPWSIRARCAPSPRPPDGLAKTDRLDAAVLAHFGEAVRPTSRPVPEASDPGVARAGGTAGPAGRHDDGGEKSASAGGGKRPPADSRTHHLARTGAGATHPRAGSDVARAARCGGSARTCCAVSPASGRCWPSRCSPTCPNSRTLAHKQLAALVGVAPLNRDSGAHTGKRLIWGGRARVRTALYMATLSGIRYNSVLACVLDPPGGARQTQARWRWWPACISCSPFFMRSSSTRPLGNPC